MRGRATIQRILELHSNIPHLHDAGHAQDRCCGSLPRHGQGRLAVLQRNLLTCRCEHAEAILLSTGHLLPFLLGSAEP